MAGTIGLVIVVLFVVGFFTAYGLWR